MTVLPFIRPGTHQSLPWSRLSNSKWRLKDFEHALALRTSKRKLFTLYTTSNDSVLFEGDEHSLVGYAESYDKERHLVVLRLAADCEIMMDKVIYGFVQISLDRPDDRSDYELRPMQWRPFKV